MYISEITLVIKHIFFVFYLEMHLFTRWILLFRVIKFTFSSSSVYIVPSASPTNGEDGSLENPFSTIEQARDCLRESSRSSFQRVALYPTYYFLKDHPLKFDERDYLTIYTKMTENERNRIHLSRKYSLIELDFPIISGGIRLTNWTNDRGVGCFGFCLLANTFLM